MRIHLGHLAVAAVAALAAACGGTGSGSGTMSVHLVDGPTSAYTAVNIEVLTVSIHSEASGWITLGSPNKVINLLALTGGVDETLADGVGLPAGHYGQMRLLLGDKNSVVLLDGTEQALKVPSGQQSGVKLNVNFDVAPNTTKDIFIDFDAHRSVFVHEAGKSGKYLLRPVVRAYDKVMTGAIQGTLSDTLVPPHALGPDVTVTAQVVDSSGPAVVRTVKTNSSGAYTLDLLPVGATYYVVAQPVVGSAVYLAGASGATTLTAASPTATQDLSFAQTASFGTLSGTIVPPLGAEEADVVSLLQDLPAGGGPLQSFVVGVAAGSFDGTNESYAFADLPFGSYDAVVTRQGEDAAGVATFQSAAAVPVTLSSSPTSLDLTAP
jgi:hypothetical protein